MLEPVLKTSNPVEWSYVSTELAGGWILNRSDDSRKRRTRGGQSWRMRRSWYYIISERDQNAEVQERI